MAQIPANGPEPFRATAIPLINYDSTLRSASNDLFYVYNEKTYYSNELFYLADSLIDVYIAKKKLEYQNQSNSENYTAYDEVIKKINNLQKTIEDYYKHKTEIENDVSKLPDAVDKINAILLFYDYFSTNSNNFISDGVQISYRIAGSRKDANERAACYFAIGEFLQRYLYIPSSLSAYLFAAEIYDSVGNNFGLAKIENSVGRICESKNDNFFLNEAYIHYQNAGYYCQAIPDSVNLVLEQLSCEYINYNRGLASNPLLCLYEFWNLINSGKYGISPSTRNYCLGELGTYFLNLNDSESLGVAQTYYSAAIIGEIESDDVEQLYDVLFNSANLAVKVHDTDGAVSYIDKIQGVQETSTDLYLLLKNTIRISNTYYRVGFYRIAIGWAKQAVESNVSLLNSPRQNEILETGYAALALYYRELGKVDSATFFSNASNAAARGYLDEVNEIRKLEMEYRSRIDNKFIGNQNQKILQQQESLIALNRILLFTQEMLFKKSDSLLRISTEIEIAKKEMIALQNQKKDLNNDISNLEKAKRKSDISAFMLLSSTLVLLIFIWIGWRLYKGRMKENKERLEKSALLLNSKSKSRIHNLQNNYEKFLYLLRCKGNEAGKAYALRCAHFFRTVLNKWDWDDRKWTLSQELELMYEFLPTENCLNKDITIVEEFPDVAIYSARFESEVLTTLLSNSIKHGFKEKNKKFFFTIRGWIEGDVIKIEVSDNGKPDELEDYLSLDGKENGLKILKTKIETISKLNPVMNAHRAFIIEPITNQGTTIKFALPYEKIENANC